MKNSLKKQFLIMALLLVGSLSFAQGPGEPDDDEDGADELLDPAPIGDYVLPMLLVGVFVAYRLIRKEEANA